MLPPFSQHNWHLHNGGDPALTARILIHCYPRLQLLHFAALPPRLPSDIAAMSFQRVSLKAFQLPPAMAPPALHLRKQRSAQQTDKLVAVMLDANAATTA